MTETKYVKLIYKGVEASKIIKQITDSIKDFQLVQNVKFNTLEQINTDFLNDKQLANYDNEGKIIKLETLSATNTKVKKLFRYTSHKSKITADGPEVELVGYWLT